MAPKSPERLAVHVGTARNGGGSRFPLVGDQTPLPPENDRNRERIVRLQTALQEIVHNVALGHLQVGLRVIEARTGRLFFAHGAEALMDPASNQKVLATTTALVRLGSEWRFRTDIYGPSPDADGVIHGDLFLRGNGDPTLRTAQLQDVAATLVRRGVVRVQGGIIVDPRRIGDEGPVSDADERPPLVVNRGIVTVVVRPSAPGEAPVVTLTPPPPADSAGVPIDLVIKNAAITRGGKRAHLAVEVNAVDGMLHVDVSGKIAPSSPGMTFRRRVTQTPLAGAILLRAALIRTGVSIRDRASVGTRPPAANLLATQLSEPLPVLLRKINKDSDNDEAERLLETVGAETVGGSASTAKGLAVLRDALGEFGLDSRNYLSQNGSGLGHGNRITAHAMTDLLRALYLDPRIGPELLQSLSVGGVDGTTRNRFRGTSAAGHVRAKTGTLNGKSCLSGLVGEGDDVVVFAIMVQGFKSRSALGGVRAAEVAAVQTMMRYVRERGGARIDLPPGFDQVPVATDYEPGEDVMEGEGEAVEGAVRPPPDDSAEQSVTLLDQAAPTAAVGARIGVAAVGSLAGGDAAPGLGIYGGWGTEDVGFGVDLSAYGTDFRTMLGPGAGVTEWTRFAGAAGPRYRIFGWPYVLDVSAQIAAGWFWIHGHNYVMNTTSRTFAVGFGTGVRLSWERRGLAPWVSLETLGWLGNQSVRVVGITETVSIPAVDFVLSIGGSYRLW